LAILVRFGQIWQILAKSGVPGRQIWGFWAPSPQVRSPKSRQIGGGLRKSRFWPIWRVLAPGPEKGSKRA